MFVAGGAVSGEEFVGRERELKNLRQIFDGKNNFSLTGLSRIGKSSLVKELLIRNAEMIDTKKIKIINYTLTGSTSETDFVRFFFEEVQKAILRESCDDLLSTLTELKRDLDNGVVYEKQVIQLCDALWVRKQILFIIIIDEFDKAPDIFHKYLLMLRELITASLSIRLFTISRASLAKLFPLDGGGSIFPLTTVRVSLIGFSEVDVHAFQHKLKKEVKMINNAVWENIRYHAGNFPYFLSQWSNAYIEVIQDDISNLSQELIIEKMHEICEPQGDEGIEYLCRSLDRLGELSKLKEFIAETSGGGKSLDLDKYRTLNSYGVISSSESSLKLPYLKDFLARNEDSYADISEQKELLPIISTLIAECESKLATLFGSTKASAISDRIKANKRDLQAIKIKVGSNTDLADLRGFITPEITDKEINLYKQKISDCKNYLASV